MLDISYAPLFKYLTYIDELNPIIFSDERHPKLLQWKKHLLGLKVIQNSYTSELKKQHLLQMWKRQGYLSSFLEEMKVSHNIKKSTY